MDKNQEVIQELYKSVRLLLRHCISAKAGGGVSPNNLMKQMQQLDKVLGRDWTSASDNTSGWAGRGPRKRL